MKKLKLVTIISSLILTMISCEPDEQLCGKVTYRMHQDFNDHSVYYFYIGGGDVGREVSFETYNKYKQGDYICLD